MWELSKQASNSTRLAGEMHAPLLDLSMKMPSLKMMSCGVGLFLRAMQYLSISSVALQEERGSISSNCLTKHYILKAL